MTIVLLAIGTAGCYLSSVVLLAAARRAHPADRPEWRPTVLELRLRRIRSALGVAVAVALVALLLTTLRNPAARSAPAPTTTTPAPYAYIPTPAGPPSNSPTGGDR